MPAMNRTSGLRSVCFAALLIVSLPATAQEAGVLGFGALGWLMMRYDWPAAPMVLGLVLGVIFENSLRQALTLSHGSISIFFTRPISAFLLACALAAVLAPWIIKLARSRKGAHA